MKYVVRVGSNSKSEVVELDDDWLRFAKEAGYDIVPLKQELDEVIDTIKLGKWMANDGMKMLNKIADIIDKLPDPNSNKDN